MVLFWRLGINDFYLQINGQRLLGRFMQDLPVISPTPEMEGPHLEAI